VDRITGSTWTNLMGGTNQSTLDDSGNPVRLFGSSCAAGSSEVIADTRVSGLPTYNAIIASTL
jgi:hypothetical protein